MSDVLGTTPDPFFRISLTFALPSTAKKQPLQMTSFQAGYREYSDGKSPGKDNTLTARAVKPNWNTIGVRALCRFLTEAAIESTVANSPPYSVNANSDDDDYASPLFHAVRDFKGNWPADLFGTKTLAKKVLNATGSKREGGQTLALHKAIARPSDWAVKLIFLSADRKADPVSNIDIVAIKNDVELIKLLRSGMLVQEGDNDESRKATMQLIYDNALKLAGSDRSDVGHDAGLELAELGEHQQHFVLVNDMFVKLAPVTCTEYEQINNGELVITAGQSDLQCSVSYEQAEAFCNRLETLLRKSHKNCRVTIPTHDLLKQALATESTSRSSDLELCLVQSNKSKQLQPCACNAGDPNTQPREIAPTTALHRMGFRYIVNTRPAQSE